MRKTVRSAMTSSPTSVGPETSCIDAARLMGERDVGSLPVVDRYDILVGIVTDRDIALRVVAAGKDPGATVVGDILTDQLTCAYPDEPLDEAIDMMAYRRVRRLPVVEDDRLVGMLSQADVVHEVKGKEAGKLVDEISRPLEPAGTS